MAVADRRSPLKERPLRGPGASVQDQIVDRVFGRLLPAMWIPSLFWVLVLNAVVEDRLHWRPPALAYLILAVSSSVIAGFVFWRSIPGLNRLRLGRDGERSVAEILDQAMAPIGARVLHDVPGKGFNLDHVVIAPQGVFVVETKTRSKGLREQVALRDDGLLIGGRRPDRDPLCQVEAGARWLSQWLERNTRKRYPVKGAVVFPGWWVRPMSRAWLRAGRPWVLSPKGLAAFLHHEPVRLSRDEIQLAADRLRDYIGAFMEALERT
jgi:hypothetical protein